MDNTEEILAIPVGKKDNHPAFRCISIKKMNGQEFLDWMDFVKPWHGIAREYAEVFDDYQSRLKMFQDVVLWWSVWNTNGTKEPVAVSK